MKKPPNRGRRILLAAGLTVGVVLLLLLPLCTGGGRDRATEALLAETTRIEIVVPIAESGSWRDIEPHTIEDPSEIARLRAALELRPTTVPASWRWPQRIRWVLEDGRVVEMAVGASPDLLGVKLPGGSPRDHQLPDRFLAAIRPHLEEAVAHYEAACEGKAPPTADGHRP